jgi:hypothetical protein
MGTYALIGFINVGLVLSTTLIILLTELFYWTYYWVQRIEKPRKFFWSRIANWIQNFTAVREIDDVIYYGMIILSSFLSIIIVLVAWPIILTLLVFFIIIASIRACLDQKKEQ